MKSLESSATIVASHYMMFESMGLLDVSENCALSFICIANIYSVTRPKDRPNGSAHLTCWIAEFITSDIAEHYFT